MICIIRRIVDGQMSWQKIIMSSSLESSPCLHAKRIIVVGNVVKTAAPSQTSDQTSVRDWLEKAPPLSRFKVPVEAERLIENEVVLEQYLSPASPMLAGFRLDGFTAIKPRITHSPSSMSAIVWENTFISAPVLYIQVSVLQEKSGNMVVVSEYRLPEVKGGIPMYFDFPRPINSRRVCFRLVGDVTAFADDPMDVDDTNSRLATGLSLSNRVKLYYYADPYELGKWASLSAV